MQYALNESFNAKYFTLTITEHSSCGGLIPHNVKKSPLVSSDPRTRLFVNSVPKEPKYFVQSRDLANNLRAKNISFTHFEIVASDINLANQTTKDAQKVKNGPNNLFYLEFRTDIPISVKATFYGNTTTTTLDTNSTAVGVHILRFPMDFQFGSNGPDALRNGYPSEGTLIAAWKKYGNYAQSQWRDKAISTFLTSVFTQYKEKHISFSKYAQSKVYSDKNKKGGYEAIVSNAEVFKATMDEIEADFKQGSFKKYWTTEYQRRFSECSQVWKQFLDENGTDLTVGNKLISAEYKQKIFLNYLNALMFSGQFDKVQLLIETNINEKLKADILFDMKRIRAFNEHLRMEFEAHSNAKGWVRM